MLGGQYKHQLGDHVRGLAAEDDGSVRLTPGMMSCKDCTLPCLQGLSEWKLRLLLREMPGLLSELGAFFPEGRWVGACKLVIGLRHSPGTVSTSLHVRTQSKVCTRCCALELAGVACRLRMGCISSASSSKRPEPSSASASSSAAARSSSKLVSGWLTLNLQAQTRH